MSALVLTDVARSFGGLPAVDGVSISVGAGKVTGLIGPNGAGKTTLINLITGLLKLTKGSISFGGREVSEADAASLARMGFARTFQNIRLLANATTLENVVAGFHLKEKTGLLSNFLGLPAAKRERRFIEDRARELLARFDMLPLQDHPAGSLSYGHQRRIEMMRALAMDPSVLLLDEPVAGMNDAEANALSDLFRRVAADGVAILLVEHNMRFIMSLCDHIYVLAAGRIIAEGNPDEVGRNPRVIEAYLGSD